MLVSPHVVMQNPPLHRDGSGHAEWFGGRTISSRSGFVQPAAPEGRFAGNPALRHCASESCILEFACAYQTKRNPATAM